MVQYDPSLIMKFADQLYAEANWIAVRLTLLGGFGAGALGLVVPLAANGFNDVGAPMGIGLVLAVVGAVAGYSIGNARGFSLRLRAQEALCQLQVEINTRPAAPGYAPGYAPQGMPQNYPRG